MIKLAMIGDYNGSKTSHKSDKLVTTLHKKVGDSDIKWDWIETSDLSSDLKEQLGGYQGIWCVPGSLIGIWKVYCRRLNM